VKSPTAVEVSYRIGSLTISQGLLAAYPASTRETLGTPAPGQGVYRPPGDPAFRRGKVRRPARARGPARDRVCPRHPRPLPRRLPPVGVPGWVRCGCPPVPVSPAGWGRAKAPAVTCAPHRRSPWDQRKLATPAECGNVDPFRQGRGVADAADRPDMARLNVRSWDSRVQLNRFTSEVGPIRGFRRSIVAAGRSHPPVETWGGPGARCHPGPPGPSI